MISGIVGESVLSNADMSMPDNKHAVLDAKLPIAMGHQRQVTGEHKAPDGNSRIVQQLRFVFVSGD